jgi:hypothetical protein
MIHKYGEKREKLENVSLAKDPFTISTTILFVFLRKTGQSVGVMPSALFAVEYCETIFHLRVADMVSWRKDWQFAVSDALSSREPAVSTSVSALKK